MEAVREPVALAIVEHHDRWELRPFRHFLCVFLGPLVIEFGTRLQLDVAFDQFYREHLDHSARLPLMWGVTICAPSTHAALLRRCRRHDRATPFTTEASPGDRAVPAQARFGAV